jgi:hypothetical protein
MSLAVSFPAAVVVLVFSIAVSFVSMFPIILTRSVSVSVRAMVMMTMLAVLVSAATPIASTAVL